MPKSYVLEKLWKKSALYDKNSSDFNHSLQIHCRASTEAFFFEGNWATATKPSDMAVDEILIAYM